MILTKNQTYSLVLSLMLFLYTPPVLSKDYVLHADDWQRPRSAEYILSLPSVRHAVQKWLSNREQTLFFYYPGGETGLLWATELEDWLIALGIPSKNIQSVSGSPRADQLIIRVD